MRILGGFLLLPHRNLGGYWYVPSRIALAIGVTELYPKRPLSGPEHIGAPRQGRIVCGGCSPRSPHGGLPCHLSCLFHLHLETCPSPRFAQSIIQAPPETLILFSLDDRQDLAFSFLIPFPWQSPIGDTGACAGSTCHSS